MKNCRFLLLSAIVAASCALTHQAMAQKNTESTTKPIVSLSIIHNASSWTDVQQKHRSELMAGETRATIFLRERTMSISRRDTAFQTGSIAIVRSEIGTENLLVVAYSLEYLDSALNPLPNVSSLILHLPTQLPLGAIVSPPFPAPLPIAVNGLQGDLSPTTTDANGLLVTVNAASRVSPNTINIQPGQTRVTINFAARWSDQSYAPRSAGLQGRRYARLTLLRLNDMPYDVGVTLATVMLDDPQPVAPVLVNAIQNKQLMRNASDLIELDTPGFRSDGLPNAVFYDANYNVLTYAATSSDNTIITVAAFQNDVRLDGRSSLFYAVQPGAQAGSASAITIIANDGTGLLAGNIFTIQVTNITSVRSAHDVMLSVAPNPSADFITIESVAEQTELVRVRFFNALSREIFSGEQTVSAGAPYRYIVDVSSFPSGVYMVEVRNGSSRNMRKVVKN